MQRFGMYKESENWEHEPLPTEEELYLEIEEALKKNKKPSFKQFTRNGLETIPQRGGDA